MTGTSAINGTGNASNNVITGNSGNNLLTGGAGVDTLIGGIGDDTYVVDNDTDTITEAANEGNDTVQASVSYVLSTANVENLTLIGTAAINGTGSTTDNLITGNQASNALNGGDGNDTLDGGVSEALNTGVIDTLNGDAGNDTFLMRGFYSGGVFNGGTGTDTLDFSQSSAGTAARRAAEGAGVSVNLTTGDASTYYAKASNFTWADPSGHITLSNIENVIGTNRSDLITGDANNNTLDGGVSEALNTGVIDTLNGDAGNDTFLMRGFYSAGIFNGGTGTDTLDFSQSSAGTAARRAAEGAGVSVNLTTGDASTYYLKSSNFTWADANGRINLSGIENLRGTAQADTLTGDAGNNLIEAGVGNDLLTGGAGVDTLIGGIGDDSFTGGIGADIFKWNLADKGTPGTISNNTDTITDFSVAEGDRLDLRDLLSDENNINILNYIDVIANVGNTTIHISSTGGFTGGNYAAGNEDARIVLNNVDLFAATGMTNEANLLQNLIQNNKLIIDA
ncbi:MAG: beta strand repeat-containing protein [Methylophilaceae bacterium]